MVRKDGKDDDDLAKNCFIPEAKVYDEQVNKLWQLKKNKTHYSFKSTPMETPVATPKIQP